MKDPSPQPPVAKTPIDRIEQWLKILASVAGILVPFLILILGSRITENQKAADTANLAAAAAREGEARNLTILLQIGPWLFDKDPIRTKYAIGILKIFRTTELFILPLLELTKSDNPSIADSATQAIINQTTPTQIAQAYNTDSSSGQQASVILEGEYYVALYTAKNTAEASVFIKNKESLAQKINDGYRLECFPDDKTGLVGVAIVPALNIEAAQAAAGQLRSMGISSAYIISASKVTRREKAPC